MIEINISSFAYKGEESLFSSLSLKMEKGERILILSEPGSGKTSLARLLTGSAEKYCYASRKGTFFFDSIDLFSLDVNRRKDYVARSSQNTDEAILMPTVADEIAFPLEQKGICKAEMDRIIESLLEKYDLKKYEFAETGELSGGEKRRLNLATLDAVGPRLFIYDEAFDELSASWRKKLLGIMREKEYSITLGSHYLKEYADAFTSVYELRNKTLVPYEEKEISFSFPETVTERRGTLEVKGIQYTQKHRSSIDENPFVLSAGNMEIKRGKAYLLTGENGAGKSTLSRILAGLLEEDKGMIAIDGKKVNAKERRQKIAYLFQNPYSQLYLPTVRDELLSVARDEDEALSAAGLFGLCMDDYTLELSYGKAKMLQSAIFYILNRPFAVFDEIDSAISYGDTEKILSLYLERGAGILMISHDERIISSFSGMHYVADGGKVHEL